VNKKQVIFSIIILVLIIDQALKIYVKTHIPYGDGFNILGLNWARIHFIENEGMAFGLSYGGVAGKYLLSIFRIFMVSGLLYVLYKLYKADESLGFIASFSLIIAGAIGNIIDSAFYGLIFSESKFHGDIATMFPPEGGYAPFLQGKVVDMFYFPMVQSTWPDWMPVVGGEDFLFFRPVFNVADSAITVGVVLILIFYRRFFKSPSKKTDPTMTTETAEN